MIFVSGIRFSSVRFSVEKTFVFGFVNNVFIFLFIVFVIIVSGVK